MAPTILFVPGSYATPAYYAKILAVLQERGYEAQVVPLLSANDGSRMPPATMEDDAAHIRAAITAVLDTGKDVLMVPHSYGGAPTSSALRGLSKADRPGKAAVVGIVYLAAYLLPVGASVRGTAVEHGIVTDEFRVGFPGGYMPPIDPAIAPFLFNDIADPSEVTHLMSTFTRQSSDSFSGEVSYAAWMDIPSLQIIPDKDFIVPVDLQEFMYKQALAAGGRVTKVIMEGAGHSLQASIPQELADEILKHAAHCEA